MSLGRYVRKALTLPPQEVARKATAMLRDKLAAKAKRRRDERSTTYPDRNRLPARPLLKLMQALPAAELKPFAADLAILGDYYMAHRFDLLGSGWVQVRHGMTAAGVGGYTYKPWPALTADPDGRWLEGRINSANLAQSQRLWKLVDPGYEPIDWHLDFKCGYRWEESTWFLDVTYAHKPGVDIKVPWEISRMQHLPQLAWCYGLAASGHEGFAPAEVYRREFRNQVLDFIATNPPRYGACWRCPMDVAIRAANWTVAYDLFRAYGAEFDAEFDSTLSASLYAHGHHIMHHLEYHPVVRGNHYLSDIVGLLFIAAHLPSTPEIDAWLAFGVQELVGEVQSQFHPDGSNFEASTVYHRLSGELVVYGTALVLGLPDEKRKALERYDHRLHTVTPPLRPAPIPHHPTGTGDSPFPAWYIERLERIAAFTLASTRPDGAVVQFGDNDSGRFLKLLPVGHPRGPEGSGNWHEDFLDHRHLVGALHGLFERSEWAVFAGPYVLEGRLVARLAGRTLPTASLPVPRTTSGEGLLQGLALTPFPDFGLYAYRSERLYLAVRCGHIGQNGNGGHAHNDALAFELALDGRSFVVDPGTYLYTPLPDERNRFRSTRTHGTLTVDGSEQNGLGEGVPWLFGLEGRAHPHTIEALADCFIGEHTGFAAPHRRMLTIMADGVAGRDVCHLSGTKAIRFPLDPAVTIASATPEAVELRNGPVTVRLTADSGTWHTAFSNHSPAYGLVQPSHVAWLETTADEIEWRLTLVGPAAGQG